MNNHSPSFGNLTIKWMSYTRMGQDWTLIRRCRVQTLCCTTSLLGSHWVLCESQPSPPPWIELHSRWRARGGKRQAFPLRITTECVPQLTSIVSLVTLRCSSDQVRPMVTNVYKHQLYFLHLIDMYMNSPTGVSNKTSSILTEMPRLGTQRLTLPNIQQLHPHHHSVSIFSFFSAIVCLWLDFGLPPRCPHVV